MKFHPLSIAESIQDYLKDERVFVLYKKPKDSKVRMLLQQNTKLYTTKTYVEPGFVFAPFDMEKETILIPFNESESCYFDLPKNENTHSSKEYVEEESAQEKHIHLVQKALDFIHIGKADKVVISRFLKREFNREQVGVLYERLLYNYPNAFVYIWSHPKVGLWMGASPEKLLEVKEGIFSTMSLAGTQQYAETLQWKTKEQKEQEWVTDYIINQLKPITESIEISKPFTHKAGHLAHIRTDIKAQLMHETSLKNLILALHPTPAVCGTPRAIAKEFILNNEGYSRGFYTGFLGEVNKANISELYVNLRCMQIKDSFAKLYVGGGITKESVPEKEWGETFDKARVLGRFL